MLCLYVAGRLDDAGAPAPTTLAGSHIFPSVTETLHLHLPSPRFSAPPAATRRGDVWAVSTPILGVITSFGVIELL